jgi:hypothetical protein
MIAIYSDLSKTFASGLIYKPETFGSVSDTERKAFGLPFQYNSKNKK